MVGLLWKPTYTYPDVIYREGQAGNRERTLVVLRVGDAMLFRSPSYYEARRLRTLAREPVVEVRRVDGTREIYRSSLAAFRFDVADVLASAVDGGGGDIVTDASIVFRREVESPDLTKAQWRQVYEDIRADIENGRLKPGDRIPTVQHLATMYSFSSPSALKAVQILQGEEWVEARSRIGRFVKFKQRRQTP